ncbi:SCO family protein [Paracoccus sp. 1_MG-2023]|uniref:SCO family protein n=1 Tax=unclassified Paracoccus (in: a-proteobacteria) TaxID=2688777 RepID=UPI001C092394|nr:MULTISPECIES: SCO family protein [unclassified Paracoccus (in: a-proteobacteria)]MBU2957203.1 SCO family protein [Paracoccus sp. C2R09]MDO6669090.1 SCO family protein [Paracoccus sp. 1_MG-2023]
MADRRIMLAAAVASGLLLVGGGAWLAARDTGTDYAQCRNGNVAGGMDSFGTEFTLTNTEGDRLTSEQVFDRPSLLYFGYTFCPDVCPLDTARNAEAVAQLEEQGVDVQNVFITVDPRRDTPEVLGDFTSLFPGRMIGLTGSEDEIAAVNKGWRNYYKAHDEEDDEYYLVDHMTNTYLVMPGQGTVDYFGRDAAPEKLVETVGCFLNAS